MINSKILFKWNNSIFMEIKNDEDSRFSYIDPRSYEDMKLIANVTPRTNTFVEVFDNLVILINQNLNWILFTKTKELTFQLNRDMIDVIAVEKINNGFLIAWNAFRNGNPGML